MGPLLLSAVDVAQTAKGLEERPFPYFLALVIAAVGVLWGSLVTVALWGARGQLQLQRERSEELKAERDAERKEADRVRAEHMRDLVRLTSAAETLTEIKREMQEKKARRASGVPP